MSTATTGISASDDGTVTYPLNNVGGFSAASVSLTGCVDNTKSSISGTVVKTTLTIACPAALPVAIASGSKDISVTNGEKLSFNAITTLFTGAGCIKPSTVNCKVAVKPTSVAGISTTLAANPTITATSATVGFTETITVTCEFDPANTKDTKSVTANAYTIKQNCNPVAKAWFAINSATYAASATATNVGTYTNFFTQSPSACWTGAKTLSGGTVDYTATPTCKLSSPASTSFAITSDLKVTATPNINGGFNQTVGISCTFPSAYVGTYEVITGSTINSKWTSFTEQCAVSQTPPPISNAYSTIQAKVPLSSFFKFGTCTPTGLSCTSSNTAYLTGVVTTVDGTFSMPVSTVGGYTGRKVSVTCSYGAGTQQVVTSGEATLTQPQCGSAVKSVATKASTKAVTYMFGAAPGTSAITTSTYWTTSTCIQDLSKCTLVSSNKTVGVSLT